MWLHLALVVFAETLSRNNAADKSLKEKQIPRPCCAHTFYTVLRVRCCCCFAVVRNFSYNSSANKGKISRKWKRQKKLSLMLKFLTTWLWQETLRRLGKHTSGCICEGLSRAKWGRRGCGQHHPPSGGLGWKERWKKPVGMGSLFLIRLLPRRCKPAALQTVIID